MSFASIQDEITRLNSQSAQS